MAKLEDLKVGMKVKAPFNENKIFEIKDISEGVYPHFLGDGARVTLEDKEGVNLYWYYPVRVKKMELEIVEDNCNIGIRLEYSGQTMQSIKKIKNELKKINQRGDFSMESLTGSFEIIRLDEGYEVLVRMGNNDYIVAEETDPVGAVADSLVELIDQHEQEKNKEEHVRGLEDRLDELKK